MKILLELEAHEALMILDPIQDKALTASKNAARWSGDEREIAEITATVCNRIATRIVDGLYPEHETELVDLRREDLLAEIEFGLV